MLVTWSVSPFCVTRISKPSDVDINCIVSFFQICYINCFKRHMLLEGFNEEMDTRQLS